MNLFLKIKNWQLFLIIFVLHYVVQGRLTFLLIETVYLLVYSSWIYSISVAGQKKLLEIGLQNIKTNYLKICCLITPLLWLIIVTDVPSLIMSKGGMGDRIILIILSFVFLGCFIYMPYFASKIIKTIELQRIPRFKNCVVTFLGSFLMLWLIGMWFIQPKVNKIFFERNDLLTE